MMIVGEDISSTAQQQDERIMGLEGIERACHGMNGAFPAESLLCCERMRVFLLSVRISAPKYHYLEFVLRDVVFSDEPSSKDSWFPYCIVLIGSVV